MLGSHLQATTVKLALQEKVFPPEVGPSSSKFSQGSAKLEEVLPPDPGTRSSTAMGAVFERFTSPADYYLLANPRLAEAPETSTSVLCTGQRSFGFKVNYVLTPMYPQHTTLTKYEIIANALKARITIDVRAIRIVANALKACASCALSQPNPSGALSLEPSTSPAQDIQLGNKHFLSDVLPDTWRTQTWRGLTKFFMLGSHLQATAIEIVLQEKVLPPEAGPSYSKLSQGSAKLEEVLPPDPGTRSSTATAASFERFTLPADYYVLANPRLAEAPFTSTSVLCTCQ